MAFVDIAVTTNEFGAPKVKIDYKKNLDISEYDIHVSLSDDQPFAVAFAVITS